MQTPSALGLWGNDAPLAAAAGGLPIPDDHAEILRLRDKLHDLEKQVWGLNALARETARGLGGLRDQLHDLSKRIDAMSRADDVAKAVLEAQKQERGEWFTFGRKLSAAVIAVVVAVPAAHDLIGWLGG